MTVEETIIEVSTRHSPNGERYVSKPYPKSNLPRTFGVDGNWLEALALHLQTHHIARDQPLFTTTAGTPNSRNTFRTRIWLPAVKTSGIDFPVRMHEVPQHGGLCPSNARADANGHQGQRAASRPASAGRSWAWPFKRGRSRGDGVVLAAQLGGSLPP